MKVYVVPTDNRPIYEQIKEQIKNLIYSGQLKSGELLPSIRELAKTLKISVITTKRAYDDLEKEGYIVTRQGKGSYVNYNNTEFIIEKRKNMIEEKLLEIIELCVKYNISKEELIDNIQILYG